MIESLLNEALSALSASQLEENFIFVTRPKDLPEYVAPPLNEVVFSAQFVQPKSYTQIRAKEVWDLYKNDFPIVQEHPAVPQTFETFGLPQTLSPSFQFVTGVGHNRYWFLSSDQTELIQFQQDRIMHNWRRNNDSQSSYPRFDNVLPKFKSELESLETYFVSNFQAGSLVINQCELTYVNRIALKDDQVDRWIRIQNFDGFKDYEGVSFNTSKILYGEDRAPYARMFCQINLGVSVGDKMERLVDLRLIVRGVPPKSTIEGTLDFMKSGRVHIVSTFDKMTTDYAHDQWGKKVH